MKVVGNSTIYLKDVSNVADGFIPQTNIVRHNGRRGVLVSIIKAGDASTLSVVNGIRQLLPRVEQTLSSQLRIQPLADQSLFVRAAIEGVVREATIAAGLTALMILLFLGSWRSTVIIAVSIPLAILTSVIVLSAIGETINTMTLGGLALAVGILVDDATVTIENITRHLEEGQPLYEGILHGAAQIATPAFVSTTCICIAFMPLFALQGVSHYLFPPLAEAIIFAMLASYILSRTLVPTMAMYLLKEANHNAAPSRNPLVRMQKAFDRGFERVRQHLPRAAEDIHTHTNHFHPGFSSPVRLCCGSSFRGSAATSSPVSTVASSSSISGPKPEPASKIPPCWPTRSKRRSVGRYRSKKWQTSLITSACPTAS